VSKLTDDMATLDSLTIAFSDYLKADVAQISFHTKRSFAVIEFANQRSAYAFLESGIENNDDKSLTNDPHVEPCYLLLWSDPLFESLEDMKPNRFRDNDVSRQIPHFFLLLFWELTIFSYLMVPRRIFFNYSDLDL
jgi:hypothetical protein